MCRSRSGATPSKMRAPSNTVEPSQLAWERGPMIGGLPSCQSPAYQVQVFEYQATRFLLPYTDDATKASSLSKRCPAPPVNRQVSPPCLSGDALPLRTANQHGNRKERRDPTIEPFESRPQARDPQPHGTDHETRASEARTPEASERTIARLKLSHLVTDRPPAAHERQAQGPISCRPDKLQRSRPAGAMSRRRGARSFSAWTNNRSTPVRRNPARAGRPIIQAWLRNLSRVSASAAMAASISSRWLSRCAICSSTLVRESLRSIPPLPPCSVGVSMSWISASVKPSCLPLRITERRSRSRLE